MGPFAQRGAGSSHNPRDGRSVSTYTAHLSATATAPAHKAPGAWVRGAAFLIDAVIITLVGVLIVALPVVPFLLSRDEADDASSSMAMIAGWYACAAAFFVIFAFWTGFRIWMESRHQGTFGKKVMGLKVVGEDGSPLNLLQAFARNSWYYFSLVPVVGLFVPIVMGVLIGSDEHKRSPFDRFACALVVYK